VPASATVGPLAAGSYSFQAAYSGDANYAGSTGPCEPFSAGQAGTSTAGTVFDAGSSAPWAGTETAGASAYDGVAISGMQGGIFPTGTVTYTYFTSKDCSAGGSVNKVVTLNADGSVPASATVGPLAAGSYSFQAAYSGDANYAGSTGPCEPFTVSVKPLVVSLTFDDGNLDQYTNALPILQQYGMQGTFYIITGYIGNLSGYMTLPDLQAVYNAGNEIAAHTVLHAHLSQVSTDEATREICQSRDTLLNWGFPVTDFAYPYGETNAAVENIVQQCGLNSARLSSDLKGPFSCLSGCPLTDAIPPADPYFIKTPDSLQDNWSLSDLENLVTNAESTGGWLPVVFHHICDNDCDQYSISPANFSAFLAWLQTQNVSVQNVNQVMGGPVSPPVSAPQVSPAPPGVNAAPNPSLETADANNAGFPNCWRTSTGGTNDASFAEISNAHTGSVAETITINNYTSGDAKLITVQDLGQCSPAVVPGDAYVASAWYKSTTPTRLVFYYRDTNGGWHFWTQSPQFAASSSWAQATWSPPAIPSNATALSYGLNIQAVGTLTTDDYSLADTGGPPTSPSVTLTGPAAGSTVSGQATLTSNASSPIGIARVDYLVNGAVVATSTSAPYTATWDSSTVGDGPVTITARATDINGTQTTSAPVSATISNAASRGGNMLANASLETATNGSTPDCWQLSGTGTNTATWTRTSNAHSGSWAENVAITAFTSGDRKLITSQGTSACSPRVNAGSTYNLGGWYESNQPARIAVYYLSSTGTWTFWTQSPQFAASSGWAHATWTTPAVPAGATALSFGINLAAVGSLTTDDYTMTSN
jgi:peptidoglycan/xylan/chitin deacetylase (PgdA/CDA1 family)